MPKRILIIDDDTDLLALLDFLLPDLGYIVQTWDTGDDFFHRIEKFKPGLILLDMNLGETDGREICRSIKSANHTGFIPVIMISADDTIYDTLSEYGVNDIISKPFNFDHLAKMIERHIVHLPD
jgi:DNA-binding response OmpR family regulator